MASSGREDVKKTQDALKIDYPLVPGPLPGLFKQYGAYNDEKKVALPTTIIIDRNGVIRWQHVGKDDNDRVNGATVIEQLRKLP